VPFLAAAAVLVFASTVNILMSSQKASALQLTERKIRITSSKVGQSGVTYNVSFKPAQTTAIKGIVVDLCMDSPLVGTTCSRTNGATLTPTSGTINVTSNLVAPVTLGFTANNPVNVPSQGNGLIILTNATGFTTGDLDVTKTITFAFTATNPTVAPPASSFYARIITYTATATATAYDSSTVSSANPGTHIDEGGVALSTANQLNINARIQEQLEFCVSALDGTIDTNGEVPASCAALNTANYGTTVDLGVIDSGAPSITPIAASSGGNGMNGGILIRTNAANGAVISYFAEQAGTGTFHLGALRVPGAPCTNDAVPSISVVDQCFNSAGATQVSFSSSGEKFGMTAMTPLFNASTSNLLRSTNYIGDGLPGTGFAWEETAPAANVVATPLATSTTVLDYELLVLRFAAQAAATTPTGSYTVTSTYIATSTF
jgi:hypothetical protein